MNNGQLRQNAILFLFLSIGLQIFNRVLISKALFGEGQRAWMALLLSLAAPVLAWMSLQVYRKAAPTGSNLGCVFLVAVGATIIVSVLLLFGTLAYFFNYTEST